ncbi:DctP family TRAP transporter solute-binding subunit [Cytobacillus kochii]|uniref:DctP family TRAP transporter solute-binding subunit n=1 Tax=Cytobacillus kochii TaxID=859143 RepID=UPI00203D5758|nr:DctP family TRAP transporter solute-binding subunit [Cytobacillus kochii]MCM3323562.1 DctP family TRAP transporter solute-binding subunit [Cytobacillus kochii]MCM3345957.1 DctP family TRAP transporter solute-binding subunit [Cytobacillus kochii]
MRKRKLSFLFIVSAIFSLFIAGCSSGSTNANGEQELDLKMSITISNTSTWYKAAEQFSNEVKENTDSRINIKIYPNEQLTGGDSGKTVESLSKGTVDLTYNSTIIYSILNDKLGVLSAPFLFKDGADVDSKLAGEGGEAIKQIIRDFGVEPLGFGENGFRQVTNSVREIKTPEDIEGLKVRIPGIKMYTDLWTSYGANPATMTMSEVFTALQTGTVDGQENPIDVIHSSKLQEVQKYTTMWNYSYDPLILGMNKKLYDSLSNEDKQIIQTAAENANKFQIELARETEKEQIKEMEEAGVKFYYPTEEELAAFKEKAQPIYNQYKDVWGEDLLNLFLEK